MGMTINAVEVPCERTPLIQASSKLFKHGNLPNRRLVKIDFATEGSICSLGFRHGKLKKNLEYKSPYLSGDSVHLLSRVTEKRLVHKKGEHIVSSFPLATNIYKANSDEFKALKKNKKVQKSVLTLPNEPAPAPQMCTVSDVNDAEYYNRTDDHRKKTKKRTAAVYTRLGRRQGDDIEFYDRDAKYCSQMGINLDCSSTDMLKKHKGDGKKTSKLGSNAHVEEKSKPHDVWAVLRNINRFQFRPSPAISEDSFVMQKKLKCPKRRNNRKDMRFVETRCTEEFAYISSFDVDNSAGHSLSQASSFDKITVIDNHNKLTKLCKGLEEKVTKKKKVRKMLNPAANKLIKCRIQPTKLNNCKPMICINHKDQGNVNRDPYLITGHNHEELKQLLSNSTITNENIKNKINVNSCGAQNHATSHTSQSSDFIYSCDSSKAAYCRQRKHKKKKDLCKSALLQDSNEQFGVTRTILSNGQGVLHANKAESPNVSPRQIIPKSNSPVYKPKHAKTEIKRRIINQNIPIVILGKDQLGSAVEVIHEDPPQFNGLDQQIWPFMLSWYGLERANNACKKQRKFTDSIEQLKIDKYEEVKKKWLPMNNRYKQLKKFSELKTNCIPIPAPIAEISNKSHELEKPKAIHQLRDRMLKLLYKNSSIQNVIDESHSSDTTKNENDSNANKDSICTNIRKITQTTPNTTKPKLSPVPDKRPWAKAKWASDFIDNVIRKIKAGAYYTHDNKVLKRKSSQESKTVDIQTVSMTETLPLPSPVTIEQIPLLNTCDDKSIQALTLPGFDDALPAVEIKSMTMSEISVKHCVTNVMFHFDVTVPPDSIVTMKNSSTLIPLEVSKSQTRTFKCQTSILNAMLPAELCTILPKMLRNIIESGELLALPPSIDKTSSQLSIITEVAQSESYKEIISPLSHSIVPHLPISQKLWRLLNGRYQNSDKLTPKIHILGKDLLKVKYNRALIENLKPHLSRIHLFECEVDPTLPVTVKCLKDSVQSKVKLIPITPCEQVETCTALQLYPVSDRRLVPTFGASMFKNFFRTLVSFANEVEVSSSNIINTINNYAVTINVGQSDVRNIITLNVNFGLNFPFDGKSNSNILSKASFFTKKSVYDDNSCENLKLSSLNDNKLLQRYVPVNNTNKIRKKGFVKLYKKCKSTSNISAEKATPLSKITNVDEFFLALGSGKLLSSVFDCQSGHKLLSSVKEMKNWTTEINPRQALLVLLLTSKKDTPSIMRYRPVLLQGIAVNRITKANELDMEIEVIERETLQTLPQYEGISYLPASIENQDNLFEELCWIAKTTASDYQKPFDKLSEKLLKSLLEKRKKLNPSYLRVMARYVGLGLLKTPNKKIM